MLFSLTVCPRSSDPFYIVTYYIKWVTTSWTDGMIFFSVVFDKAGSRFESLKWNGSVYETTLDTEYTMKIGLDFSDIQDLFWEILWNNHGFYNIKTMEIIYSVVV